MKILGNYSVNDLRDEHLLKLIKLKFEEEGMNEKIIDMQVVHRSLDGNGFRVYVTYEKWAPEETGMILNKLYISQFEYLLNEGIIKIKEE